jgi:hypothetical protein
VIPPRGAKNGAGVELYDVRAPLIPDAFSPGVLAALAALDG